MICFPVGQHPGHSRGTHGNPGGMVQFWYLFSPRGGGELFSFVHDFAGPRGHIHGICSRFGRRYIALGQSFLAPFYFISMPNFDIMLSVFILPPREGYLSIVLCPLPRGLEWWVDPRGSK